MLKRTVIREKHETTRLHGGTLGDVKLIEGTAEAASGENLSYKVVCKNQKRWERPGDPGSWRREYDLYQSDLKSAFTPAFRWPECYGSELREDETKIWMEYVQGISGVDLTIEMLESAARELGRFQGRIHRRNDYFRTISCLGDAGFLEREFNQWHTQTFAYDFLISERCRIPGFLKEMLRSGDIRLIDGKSFEYALLRSRKCDLPEHIKNMLMTADDQKDRLFARLRRHVPIVLCHRDFWIENIFFADGEIRLIDWDTTGWGFLGEDIASLIVDDTEADRFAEYHRRLVPAYLSGISEYVDISNYDEVWIPTLILIKFGYRMMQKYMFSGNAGQKRKALDALQAVYEMFGIQGRGGLGEVPLCRTLGAPGESS